MKLAVLAMLLSVVAPVQAAKRVAFRMKVNHDKNSVVLIPFFPVEVRLDTKPTRKMTSSEIVACTFEQRKENGKPVTYAICDKGYEFKVRAVIFNGQ